MSDWDIVDSGWDVVEDSSFSKEDNFVGAKFEKVVDTNPNIYLERAEKSLKEGNFNEALRDVEEARKYGSNSNTILNECSRIKNTITSYREASRHIDMAYHYMRQQKFEKAIESAKKAQVNTSNSKQRQEIEKIKQEAESAILSKSVNSILFEGYRLKEKNKNYEALLKYNYAATVFRTYQGYHDYSIEVKIVDHINKIKALSKEELYKIACSFVKDGRIYEAEEWYKYAGDGLSYYELGMLFIEKDNDKAINYLEKSASLKYKRAIVELIKIYLEGKITEVDYRKAREHYENLRLIDKAFAKCSIKSLKGELKLSIIKVSKLKGTLYPLVLGTIGFMLLVRCMLLSNGAVNPFIYSSILNVEKTKMGVNDITTYKAMAKPLATFAKNKETRIEIEDPSIVSINDGNIVGKAIGKTKINLYLNDKKVASEEISICETGVEKFTFTNIKDINSVGDTLKPDIMIFYLNNIELENVNVSISSTASNVINILEDKSLEAVGKGTATITISINDVTESYDIEIKDNYYSNNYYSSNYSNNYYGNTNSSSYGSSNSSTNNSINSNQNYNSSNSNNISNDDDEIDEGVVYATSVYEISYNDGTYMFENADSEYLSKYDLISLPEEKLAFLRNEICARHGYIFKEEPYKSYFNSKTWYRGTVNELPEGTFNKYEEANLKLIAQYENKFK